MVISPRSSFIVENSFHYPGFLLFQTNLRIVLSISMKKLVGIFQVVDGTNYMFICGSTSDISKLKVELVKVYIYVPVEGKPKLKSIEKMQ